MNTEQVVTTTPDIESVTPPRIKHICGWVPGISLCGTDKASKVPSNLHDKNAPVTVDCVVCWGLWNGMNWAEQDALWAVYE